MELWLVRTTDRPGGPRWDGLPEMCRQTASSSISRSTDSTRRHPELLWATSLRQTYVSCKQIWHTLSDVDPGVGLDPWKYVRWVGVCFDHLKCHILPLKTAVRLLQFSRLKDLYWGIVRSKNVGLTTGRTSKRGLEAESDFNPNRTPTSPPKKKLTRSASIPGTPSGTCPRKTIQWRRHWTCIKWKVKLVFQSAWKSLVALSDWHWPDILRLNYKKRLAAGSLEGRVARTLN